MKSQSRQWTKIAETMSGAHRRESSFSFLWPVLFWYLCVYENASWAGTPGDRLPEPFSSSSFVPADETWDAVPCGATSREQCSVTPTAHVLATAGKPGKTWSLPFTLSACLSSLTRLAATDGQSKGDVTGAGRTRRGLELLTSPFCFKLAFVREQRLLVISVRYQDIG